MPKPNTPPSRLRPTRSGPGAAPGASGGLERFIHRPRNLAAGAALVVALHGCTQSAEGYARDAGWIDLADREGFVVLAPGQTRAGNPNLCFNWFIDRQAGAQGAEVLSILAMIDELILSENLDRSRVFVTGLSAGGAMAFTLLMHHPQIFAGGGVIAGLPAGFARNTGEALALMRGQEPRPHPATPTQVTLAPGQTPRLSIWQGTADHIVAPVNAQRIAAQWMDLAGLDAAPSRRDRNGTRSRETWTDGSGTPLLEINRLSGLGHATPLATQGPEGVGRAAPHVVDCGHSSTRELAVFWGLIDASEANVSVWTPDDDRLRPDPETTRSEAPPTLGLREDIMAGLTNRVPDGVRALIDRSLRQAGL